MCSFSPEVPYHLCLTKLLFRHQPVRDSEAADLSFCQSFSLEIQIQHESDHHIYFQVTQREGSSSAFSFSYPLYYISHLQVGFTFSLNEGTTNTLVL